MTCLVPRGLTVAILDRSVQLLLDIHEPPGGAPWGSSTRRSPSSPAESTGIGLAVAKRFVTEGARVYVTGRRRPELDRPLEILGPRASAIQSDVSDLDDLDRVFEIIRSGGEGLDVVFANAGGGDGLATIDELRPESFDKTFGINVRGTVFTVQKALPLLNRGASIVLTGSSSASKGRPGFGIYSASKAALRQFARVWAIELAPRGIRVNTITPGPTDTIAHAVLFLASEQAGFITAAELFVGRGRDAGLRWPTAGRSTTKLGGWGACQLLLELSVSYCWS
jgi:NADP-dependent 3-hydroxy acid dehydrogenase YdfG